MAEWANDRLKDFITVFLSAIVPAGTFKWSKLLPFLNDQVAADLGVVSTFLAVLLGLFVCTYSRFPRPPDGPKPVATAIAGIGFLLSTVGLLVVLILTSKVIPIDAGWESVVNRIGYILLVVSAGAPIGYYISRT